MHRKTSSMFGQHPSKDIKGTVSKVLKGKTICMCITGSVAAMTAPIIAREFMRWDAEVIAVMSEAATQLITPELMHWSTGNPVVTKLTGAVEHIAIAGDRGKNLGTADLILVCPATANTISKIANGIDDTPVTTVATTAFGSGIPIVVVPAMHECMFHHPFLETNIKQLKQVGVEFIGPRLSEGKAKIARIDDIINRCRDILVEDQELQDYNFLLTVGPTREFIDKVRFLSNPSSGKMGMAIAEEIVARGGRVTIIMTKGCIQPPPLSTNVRLVEVNSTEDLLAAVLNELETRAYTFFISAAAISDFRPAEVKDTKISSERDKLVLNLVQNPKIIKEVRNLYPNLFVVAFKAEVPRLDEEMIDNAYHRLQTSGANLIVANDVSKMETGFEASTNEVFIIDKKKQVYHVPLKSKRLVAVELVDKMLENFREMEFERNHLEGED
ncbi:bifunctional phosphopantothenoylcysteine decarboxylase/phosphopantothenate--cysteine ligase CoaBC [Candidatus Bathyarchaeota archaeon]|nr:bifunctional phosphopantothenoylcysteine decarboxylase/phosphopantothenate--cysteine ligase CoaBC [Candidatus Bathyarchaeota archaeon]